MRFSACRLAGRASASLTPCWSVKARSTGTKRVCRRREFSSLSASPLTCRNDRATERSALERSSSSRLPKRVRSGPVAGCAGPDGGDGEAFAPFPCPLVASAPAATAAATYPVITTVIALAECTLPTLSDPGSHAIGAKVELALRMSRRARSGLRARRTGWRQRGGVIPGGSRYALTTGAERAPPETRPAKGEILRPGTLPRGHRLGAGLRTTDKLRGE